MSRKVTDIRNQTFGEWKVVSLDPNRNPCDGAALWLCECSCGTRQVIPGISLRAYQTGHCRTPGKHPRGAYR